MLEEYWPEVKPLIQRVIDKMGDNIPIEAIYADLKASERQLWVVKRGGIQAAILTLIQDYQGMKMGVLTHAGGEDFRAWESAVEPISGFFKDNGCSSFTISGRRGWKKFLEDRGFKETRTTFEMRL